MNPRQRRGLIMVIVAIAGAISVFVAMLFFIADVNSRAGSFVSVVTLAKDVKAYQEITPDMLSETEIPKRWTSPSVVTNVQDIVGLVAITDLKEKSFADRTFFTSRPTIAEGNREIAIMIDADTGVAGKVKRGDRVDIIASFAGQSGADNTANPARSTVWAQNALIIDVGVPQAVENLDPLGQFTKGEAIPITFSLPVATAVKLAYAESFAVEVRLSLRAPNDSAAVSAADATYQEGGR